MAKPTIVLFPGAWHTPEHFEPFMQRLHEAGYPTRTGQLPSVGSANAQTQTGKDVIVVMHSYGGYPGGAAAKGLSKVERKAAGHEDSGIVGLIYMCSFVANEGDIMVSKMPNQKLKPWQVLDEKTGQVNLYEPKELFYNNIDDESLIGKALQGIKSQSYASLTSPSPPPAWATRAFDGRRAYIKCHQDRVIPLIAQQRMVSTRGLDWHGLQLGDAGHSPFLSHIEPICKFIDERAQEWAL